jgi:acyl dehydratase
MMSDTEPRVDSVDTQREADEARAYDPDPIDERLLEKVRSWIGKPLQIRPGQTEASQDNLRWFALGIGDPNPLWIDPEYGRQSVLGANVAPPTFVHSVLLGVILPGPKLYAVHAGNRYRYHRRLRLGDRGLRGEGTLKDAELVTSSRGITRILSTGLVRYFRQEPSGEETSWAELEGMFWRMESSGSNKGLRYEPREPTTWSDDELEELGKELRTETRRGSEPRYWEDVSEGDSLGAIARGPYTQMDQVTYHVGSRSHPRVAFDGWWRYPDEVSRGLVDPMNPRRPGPAGSRARGHSDAKAAYAEGMPGAYDDGFQRMGVIASLITNWMGDAAFLREFEARQYKPVIPGDLLRISGEVVERLNESRVDPDTGAPAQPVKVRLEGKNQLGQVVSSGTAVVDLPRRT